MSPSFHRGTLLNLRRRILLIGACASFALAPAVIRAVEAPTAKLYVASVKGTSQAISGGRVTPLTPTASFPGPGARIETQPQGAVAMVLSNGCGVFLDQDTLVEVQRFTQEPFEASRTDLEREPSVSHTVIFVTRGLIAVSTNKLAAGSTFIILTPLGSLHIHDGKFVIDLQGDQVRISLLAGEGTVFGGELDRAGHLIKTGDQAVITTGASGVANVVSLGTIPALDFNRLLAAVDLASAAGKTVFFQTNESGEISALPVVAPSVPVEATVSPSSLPN